MNKAVTILNTNIFIKLTTCTCTKLPTKVICQLILNHSILLSFYLPTKKSDTLFEGKNKTVNGDRENTLLTAVL